MTASAQQAGQCSSAHKTSGLLLSGAKRRTRHLQLVSQGVTPLPIQGDCEDLPASLTLERTLSLDQGLLDSKTSGVRGPVSPAFPQ